VTLLAILLFGLPQQALTDDQCIKCHEQQGLDVKDTMHQKAGVGCVSCHGTDEIVKEKHKFTPAFRPARLPQIVQVCGACHRGVLEAFEPSEHFTAAARDDGDKKHRSSCSACHEYHTTPGATSLTIMSLCLECHEANSHEVTEAKSYFGEIGRTFDALHEFEGQLSRVERKPGIRISDLVRTAEAGHEDLRRLRIRQHGLEWKKLKAVAAVSADETAAAYNLLAAREGTFARRFLGLGLFLGLLALSAALIARRARNLQGAA